MKQLGPFYHHLTMRLVSYIVYSRREWQVHTRECFHTSVSISGTDGTIHHSLFSPSWDLQCTAQMFVPLGGMDWSFLCVLELLVVILYYFCGALDNLVSGQNSTQYTPTWVKLLVMLAEG